jgi:hypothetical protein
LPIASRIEYKTELIIAHRCLTSAVAGRTFSVVTATLLRVAALLALLLVVLCLGACGGNDETSAASLNERLLPPADVAGFRLHRRFEWNNSLDFVVQGVPLSENTLPSDVVEAVDDAGFDAAAGEIFEKKDGPRLSIVAIKLGSENDADELGDFFHREGLKQPCDGSCSEIASTMRVTGIPNAQGVQLMPQKFPGPNAPPPFMAYGVGFTRDSYLYVVDAGGPPGSLEKSFVLGLARALYQRVRNR